MKLKLGKFEITEENGKCSIVISTTVGSKFQQAQTELEKIEAVKLRNWLNSYINGNADE